MKTVSERAGPLLQVFGLTDVPTDNDQLIELDSELLDMVAGGDGKGGRTDGLN